MTQKSNKIFINEFFFQKTKRELTHKKTDVHHIDDFWSLGILDLKHYGENNRGYRYVLVVKGNFSKFLWTVAIKDKTFITKKNSFEKFLITSKRKPNLIRTDRGKAFYNNIFQNFLNNNNFFLEIHF